MRIRGEGKKGGNMRYFFIHTHLLSTYCIPCPVLDKGGTMENETKTLPSWSSHSSGETDSK